MSAPPRIPRPRLPLPRALTTREVAEIFRVDIRTVHQWANLGLLPYSQPAGKFGNRFFPAEEIEAWLRGERP